MAKNSRKQIMLDEVRIVDQLLKNANKSINEIAKNCGFSRQKVWRIIKNLERNNTIWGYTTIIDEEKQNKKSYVVLIKRSSNPLTKEIIERIAKREISKKASKIGIKTLTSMYTNGVYDWIIHFTANNLKDAKRFVEDLNKTYQGYIEEIDLLEKMFITESYGIHNPEINKVKDFFPDI
jgi:DNA-binding Lrp family transcriptional regulator